MDFQPVSPGDPLNISAEEWNALLGLLREGHPLDSRRLRTLLRHAATLRVRNDTGHDLPQFGVAAVAGPRVSPDDDLSRFKQDRHLRVVAPVESLHFGRFVVTLEPIAEGGFGTAVLSGFVPVQVWMSARDHLFADVATGQVTALRSCRAGAAQLLWLQRPGQIGLQWALVRLSNAAWRLWKLTSCENPDGPPLYTAEDLSGYENRVVRIKGHGGCWLVEFVPCDSVGCFDPVCVEVAGVHKTCADCKDCWRLEDCDNPGTYIYTGEDLSQYDGRVVKLAGQPDKCWKVAREKQNCQNLQAVSVEADFDDCGACTCWKLTNCYDSTIEVWTYSNLAKQLGTTVTGAIGKVVRLAEKQGCWLVADKGSQYCSAQAEKVTVIGALDKCECPCYVATRCDDANQKMLLTSATNADGKELDLDKYVGKTLRDSTGFCWTIGKITDPALCQGYSLGGMTVLEAFDDCSACQNLVKLKQCGTTTEIVTYSDLTPWGGPSVGDVYVRADGTCWEVTQVGNLNWTGNEVAFEAIGTATACSDCSKNYKLVVDCYNPDCQDQTKLPRDMVVSDPRLAGAVGNWIKLGGYCYSVSETTESATDTLGDFAGPFTSCQDCLAAGVTAEKTVVVGVCKDANGNYRFVRERWRFENGLLVEVCNLGGSTDGCFDPPTCSNECDTGSGGSGGGGGSHNCTCWCQNMPDQLNATVSDPAGTNCPCLGGGSINLTLDWTSSIPDTGGRPGWYGSAQICDGAGGTTMIEIALPCDQTCEVLSRCAGAAGWFSDTTPMIDCNNKKIIAVTICCDQTGVATQTEITWA